MNTATHRVPGDNSTRRSRGRLTLPKQFYQRSDLWGFWNSVRLFGVPLILICLIPVLHDIAPWLALLIIVPLGITISKTTLLIHEAVHLNLFKTKILNVWAGRLGGWYTLVEFAAFQQLHRQLVWAEMRGGVPRVLGFTPVLELPPATPASQPVEESVPDFGQPQTVAPVEPPHPG